MSKLMKAGRSHPGADPGGDRVRPLGKHLLGRLVIQAQLGRQRRPILGPVEGPAQADLDRMGDIDQPFLDGAAHPRAVVVLLAEVAVPCVRVRVKIDDRDGAAAAGPAQVGQRAGVVAADEERHDPGLDERAHGRLDGRVAPLDVAGHDGHIAVVHARKDVERRHVEVRVVRPQHHRGVADRAGPEPSADAVRHPGVERHTDHGQIHVLEVRHVRQPREGGRTSEAR